MQFVIAAPSDRYEALRLICSRDSRTLESKSRQLLEMISDRTIDPNGLRVAKRDGRPVGAVLAQQLVGRVAVIWPAQVIPQEGDETALVLFRDCLKWLSRSSTRLVQCPVQPYDDDAARRLQDCGFVHLADILYLVATSSAFPQEQPRDELQYVEVKGVAGRRELERVMQATYHGSLDCPRLNGLRTVGDVLEGYQATGVHRSDWWLLVRHLGKPVGCLLMTDHPSERQAELVYMGVMPEMRQRGHAHAVARHAQWLAGVAGRRQMVLAVDSANQAARNVYRRIGFWSWDRRHVWIHSLADHAD